MQPERHDLIFEAKSEQEGTLGIPDCEQACNKNKDCDGFSYYAKKAGQCFLMSGVRGFNRSTRNGKNSRSSYLNCDKGILNFTSCHLN